jgi:transcriptional regulator with XRE-family HTH domain
LKTSLTSGPDTSAAAYDIPSLLRERFHAAMRRNPRFSLRAFAKQLDIDHSTLSQVLNSRRKLSARTLQAVGKRLGLADETVRAYSRSTRKGSGLENPPTRPRSYHFDLDTFQFLSVWYHYAILALIAVEGFKTDSRWIAKVLGIDVDDVNIAIQRLLRLGLLEMQARNRWVDKSGDAEFHSAALSETACNQLNRDIHELAIGALERVPSHHRVNRQTVIAIASAKLPRLKMLADEFLSEVRELVAEGGAKDDVYQLEISLFPVTTLKNSGGNNNG